MSKIFDTIKKNKPSSSDNTINQHVSKLKKLQTLFDSDNFDFLDNPEQVTEKLSNLKPYTIRNYYNSIIVFLGTEHKTYQQYSKLRDELNKQYEDEQATGKISEKQKDNFISMEALETMIAKILRDVKPIIKKQELTTADINLLRGYTIFSILVRIPTRNDQSDMILIGKRQYNKLTEEDKQKNNYLVSEKTSMKFIYNVYKTSKNYGENIIDVPKDLEKILRMYIRKMKYKNGDNIFPISRNTLTQLLIKLSTKYIGKRVGSTMIRKIYLSSKYGDTVKSMKEDASNMGHSTTLAQKVYIKEK
jgi:hypothetical protein